MKYFIFFIFVAFNHIFASNDVKFIKIDYYIEQNEFQKALDEFYSIDFSEFDNEKKAYLYNKAGFIYFNLNKIEEALKYYLMALKFNPDLYFVYNNIGVIYLKLKDYITAKEYFLKAYEIKNNYPKVLINLAFTEFMLKNYVESYKWFIKAINCDRDYVRLRFDREKAIKKLEEIIKDNPQDKTLQSILKFVKDKGANKNGLDF